MEIYLKKAIIGLAPKDFPALNKLGDIVFITLYSGNTMKGKRICVIAIKVPVLLYIISGLLSSVTNPVQTKKVVYDTLLLQQDHPTCGSYK